MKPTPLPALLDCKGLQAELGVTRAAAEAIMRQLDTVQIDGLRKVFVRRSDVADYLEAKTFSKDRVAALARRLRILVFDVRSNDLSAIVANEWNAPAGSLTDGCFRLGRGARR